jgi:hypothetical protein
MDHCGCCGTVKITSKKPVKKDEYEDENILKYYVM